MDEVELWKPRKEVYSHCARRCGVPAAAVTLVAAHAWDVHGAKRAGLRAAWIRRQEKDWPAHYEERPDLSGDTLPAVARDIVRR